MSPLFCGIVTPHSKESAAQYTGEYPLGHKGRGRRFQKIWVPALVLQRVSAGKTKLKLIRPSLKHSLIPSIYPKGRKSLEEKEPGSIHATHYLPHLSVIT